MSDEINQKFYQMRHTLSKIKNEINTMQKKISTHSSFSSVRHNDSSIIANNHNYTSYNQNVIPKPKQITFFKYPTCSMINANHFIKNPKLISYTKRIQRKPHPVKVKDDNINVLCDILKVPSCQIKQKIKKIHNISKEVDNNIEGLFIVYKEYNHFADKNNFYVDMKKWIEGKVFRYTMYQKEIEIYKRLCGELMKNSKDDIERDEISAFVKDKFHNNNTKINKFERTNHNGRKVLSASSSLSKYNFAYNTFK